MDDLIKILSMFKEPALIICTAVIWGMWKMLMKKDADLLAVHSECNLASREDTETLSRMVTLVEILVHGRDK